MWTPLLFCLLAVTASQTENLPWKPNTLYQYALRGRTLAALHQVASQYSGIVLKAKLNVQQQSENLISVQVQNAQYADVHANLSQGWSSPIPEDQLQYQQIPLSSKPFQLKYKNGAINSMVVSKEVPTWELNILKSIASQLQVDTQAKNLQKSRINSLPTKESVNGVYKTMEDSVSGECETIYDLSPLPKVVLQNKPQLAPLPQLQGDGQLIDIVKTRNFSNCDVPSAYHFGITGLTNWEPASNQMGQFLARSSVSRIIIAGNLQRYTIQSSVTTNKIIVSPFLYGKQNGMVVSRMNLTLVDVHSASTSPQSPSNPRFIKNLVYEYNTASHDGNAQKKYTEESDSEDSSSSSSMSGSSSSSSSSSSESSESQEENFQQKGRYPRSISPNKSGYEHRSRGSTHMNHHEWENKYGQGQNDVSEDSSSTLYGSHGETGDMRLGKLSKGSSFTSTSSSSSSLSSSSSSSSSDSDSSSSSSFSWDSSEEENWQPKPTLSQAPNIPFLPMFIGNYGNSIQSAQELQGVSVVKKIAQQIGYEMQSPSAIPGQKTLKKFTILATVLRTMNARQLQEATQQLYFPLSRASSTSSSDAQKHQAWVAFRDAMAQAGTGPALLTIKEWIQSKKVQGENAAELLAVLPITARFPNLEYMNTFFALATSSEVQHQYFLNTSAILSFTELARKAFVSNSTAHNRYPVHVFGALKPKKEQPVVQQYIPYFARALKQAVSQEDSIKIRTFTLALGNLAHPRILNVFEPYLEGKEPMTHFQRLTVVVSMRKLAMLYPKVARPVLFRIYQNTGEATEVRVAAFYNLMKTNPPAQLMQRIAQFTNDDQNPQVISAVQSAIRSAAYSQQQPSEFGLNAQAAVNLLNPKKMPYHYSMKNIRSYYSQELNLGYKQAYSYIGSDDGFLSSNLFYSLRRQLGGFNRRAVGFAGMSSSLNALVDLLEEQFDDAPTSSNQRSKSQPQNQGVWSWDKINNMLNIQPSEQEQVEASLMLSTLVGKRFFAFDNHTVEQLPQLVKEAAASLRSGRSFNYTKMANTFTVTVAFPTAMGLPFVFGLQSPTLLYVGGQAQAKSNPDLASGNNHQIQIPKTIDASVDLQLVYSSRTQSSMGFVVPFNKKHYSAGVNKNLQINLPIRAQVDIDLENNKVKSKVQPLDQHNKQNLFEYSTEPYTSQHSVLQMAQNPQELLNENNKMKIVHVRNPRQIHQTFGQESTGLAFDYNYHSEQNFIDFASLYNEVQKRNDPIAAVLYAWAEESTNLNNITLTYNPQKSSARYAQLTAAYLDNSDNENNQGKNYRNNERSDSQQASSNDQLSLNSARPSSSAPDSQSRQRQFLQNAGQGIQDSNTQVFDMSAEFLGESKAQFVATVAVATSYVSPKARLLFFAEKNPAKSDKPEQIIAVAESSMPNVPHMNYLKALNADPTSYLNAEIAFGDKSSPSAKIQLKGKMQQSQARRQYLEQFPLAQKCKQQMQQGNTVLYACRNVTVRANLLDQYRLSANFEKIPDFWKNATYKAYAAMRFAAYQYVSEDFISANNPNNQIELNANFAPDLYSVNLTLDTPLFTSQFKNVRVSRQVRPFVVMHPEYTPLELAAKHYFKGLNFPTCVVDNNMAQTFDNKTYPINLGKCWHAMFHYTPKEDPTSSESSEDDDEDEISILVQDASSSSEKEAMIVLGQYNIHLQPTQGDSPAKVSVNGQQTRVSKSQMTEMNDQNGNTLVQMYALPDGEVRLYAPQQDVEIQYDGTAVKINAQNSYRSEVRGLCGTFNTQPVDDFTTPEGYVLQNPYEFAATYSLEGSSCQGPAKEFKARAQQKIANGQYGLNVVLYGNVVADQQANSRPRSNAPRSSKNQHGNQKYSSYSQKRIYVIEQGDKKCFSVQPQLQCSGPSSPKGYVTKQVDFVCLKSGTVTQQWQDLIARGVNPDFSQKKPFQTFSIEVPQNCQA